MNEVNWLPAVSFLAVGLLAGAIVLWRVARGGDKKIAATGPPLAERDLVEKYAALIVQLRELGEADDRTPEQSARERHALEHEAARVLRQMERASPSPAKGQPKHEAASALASAKAAAPASALGGFLWGASSMAALGLLLYFVTQSAKERGAGGSATGNTPMAGAPQSTEPAGAELTQAQAAVDRNPNDIAARLELTRQHLIRQDMMAVFKETQTILQRSPGEPHAMSYQALVRLAMGQADKAEEMLKEALQKDPQLLDGYIHLMLVYVKAGRATDADKTLTAASKRFPARAAQLKDLLEEMRTQSAGEPQAADAGAGAADPHAAVDGPKPAPRAPAVGSEKRVSGSLELDPSIQGQSFPGAVVFVTLREGGFGAGPPLAARRMPVSAFPMTFDIGASDSMTGQDLPEDLLIEARVDTDGDPMTRPPTDPYGRSDHVKAGTRDIHIVLKRRSAS